MKNHFFSSFITLLFLVSISHAASGVIKLRGKSYVSLGVVKSDHRLTSYTTSGSSAKLAKKGIRLEFRSGSRIVIINTLKFEFSSAVVKYGKGFYISAADKSKILDPVLKPTHINTAKRFKTVIIDPGHGGKDAGAVNRYGTEAGYNLKVAKTLRRYLKKKGFNVIMTRDTDRYLSLQQRVDFANRYPGAIFVSIHFNAASRKSARGIETFTLSPVGVAHYGRGVKTSDYKARAGNYQDSANIALATAIHGRMITRTKVAKVPDRGIKRARYRVLTTIKIPAILVEGGFMSNATEAKWIDRAAYQNSIAMAIAEGVNNYRSALNAK